MIEAPPSQIRYRSQNLRQDFGGQALLYRFLWSVLPFAVQKKFSTLWKWPGYVVAAVALIYGAMPTDAPDAPPENRAAVMTHAAKIGPFSFVQTRDGVREWEIEADRGQTEDGRETVVENVRLALRPPEGVGFRLRADRGRIDLATRDFSLQQNAGQIAVALDSGYTIATPAIHWQEAAGIMTAAGPVSVQGRNVKITGMAMSVDQRTQTIVVSGGVTAIVH